MPPLLPLAPNRTTLSNKISLLLSHRASLLAPVLPRANTATTTPEEHAKTGPGPGRRPVLDDDDDDDDIQPGNPAEGVGYVPSSREGTTRGADHLLRNRLLGKRRRGAAAGGGGGGGGGGGQAQAEPESESDDDEGRGSLGRAKRPRLGREQRGVRHGEREREQEAASTSAVEGLQWGRQRRHQGQETSLNEEGTAMKNRKKKTKTKTKKKKKKKKKKKTNRSSHTS